MKEHDIEIQVDVVNVRYILRGFRAIESLKVWLDENASYVQSHSHIRHVEEPEPDIATFPTDQPITPAAGIAAHTSDAAPVATDTDVGEVETAGTTTEQAA